MNELVHDLSSFIRRATPDNFSTTQPSNVQRSKVSGSRIWVEDCFERISLERWIVAPLGVDRKARSKPAQAVPEKPWPSRAEETPRGTP